MGTVPFPAARRSTITISELGEFGLIGRIAARFPRRDPITLGPGDDAAVVSVPGERLVATTDLLIEGRHFRRDWSEAYDIGRKAAAANFADVAAMGAAPVALLIGFAAPPDLPVEWADGFADGVHGECEVAGASVAGGDVSSADTIVLAITALGDPGELAPVTRGGARPGDQVAVAGRLGWAAAGYAVLSRGFRSPRVLVEAHRRPQPPYRSGVAAARLGATAMIDVSDGLVADLGHIAMASGARIEISAGAFEIPQAFVEVGSALGADPLRWLLAGGDDHALAGTFPAGTVLGEQWLPIGRVAEGGEGPGVTVDGEPYDAGGWEHLR